MNHAHRAAAAELVNIADTYMGELYHERSLELNAALAASAMDTSPAAAAENKQTLDEIIAEFPGWDTQRVTAETPHQFRWMQSSIVWDQRVDSSFEEPKPIPAYVIGTERTKGKVNLLLHALSDTISPNSSWGETYKNRLYIAGGIPNRHVIKATREAAQWRNAHLTEAEMSRVYDSNTGLYRLHPNRVESINLKSGSPLMPTLKWLGGCTLRASSGCHNLTAISDDTLARFDVWTTVADLAAGFSVAPQVKAILSK